MFLLDRTADSFQPQFGPGLGGLGDAEERFVFVVDGEPAVRARLRELFVANGYRTAVFATAAAYLGYVRPDAPSCVVLGVNLLDMSGLDLQRQIAASAHPPIVFAVAQADVASSVTAMKQGAVDFLTEPLDPERILQAIADAIARDRATRAERLALEDLKERYSSLSPRERQVLPLIVGGLLNKQAAAELGISEITLKSHRGRLMQKMRADSLPELVRMASHLKVPLTGFRRRGNGFMTQRSFA
jgi:FixJ family two-component response regulator